MLVCLLPAQNSCGSAEWKQYVDDDADDGVELTSGVDIDGGTDVVTVTVKKTDLGFSGKFSKEKP